MSMQCRSCLNNTAEEYIDMTSVMHIANCTYLDYFIKITMLVDDNKLSRFMCNSCLENIHIVFNFINLAQNSDDMLRDQETKELEEAIMEEDTTTVIEELETVEILEFCNADTTEVEIIDLEEEHIDDIVENYTDVEIKPQLEEFLSLDDMNETLVENKEIKTEQLEYYEEDELDDEYLIEYDEELKGDTKTIYSENKWKCFLCKRILRGDVSCVGHMNMHKKVRPYKCKLCKCAFRCKSALERHFQLRHGTISPYVCNHCAVEFSNAKSLKEHIQLEHNSNQNCSKCVKIFATASELEEHYQLVHSTAPSIFCPFCVDVELAKTKVIDHIRYEHTAEFYKHFPTVGRPSHEPNKETPWQCKICQRYLRSEAALKDHGNTHLNERPHECQWCTKKFSALNNLRNHIRLHHSDVSQVGTNSEKGSDALVKCEVCKKQLLRRNLEKHMVNHQRKEITESETKFLCAYCSKCYPTSQKLQKHLDLHNPDRKRNHSCDDCGQKFYTNNDKLMHMRRIHTSVSRSHRCSICGNTYKEIYQLRKHIALHTQRTLPCTYCDKRYARQADLDVHIRSHTGELPFACHLCERRFAIKVRLTYHLQQHYDIKHKCTECPAVYNSRGKLRMHMFKHIGMPFRCEKCPEAQYSKRDRLRNHIQRVHNRNPSNEELDLNFECNTGKSLRIKDVCELDNKEIVAINKCNESTKFEDENVNQHTKSINLEVEEDLTQEFSKVQSLIIHERNVHERTSNESETLYQCPYCNKKCAYQRRLLSHIKVVHKNKTKKFDCSVCGNTFKGYSQLSAHKRLHEEKLFNCSFCDKKYSRQADLIIHVRTHTGELPFECHICDKRFAIKVRLTYHLQKHYGIKHQCPQCTAIYDNRSKLKEHMFKHTGMPYRCEFCKDIKFSRRVRFANHMLNIHNRHMSEEELAEMFAKNTGKAVRFKVVGCSS